LESSPPGIFFFFSTSTTSTSAVSVTQRVQKPSAIARMRQFVAKCIILHVLYSRAVMAAAYGAAQSSGPATAPPPPGESATEAAVSGSRQPNRCHRPTITRCGRREQPTPRSRTPCDTFPLTRQRCACGRYRRAAASASTLSSRRWTAPTAQT